jgi:2,3-bisphosphoglycerate-dependent phosphoglycerate mutase
MGIPLQNARFTLIRHGRTTYNADHRLNGDPSIPVHLDDLGLQQCVDCRARIHGERFDVAIHTPFIRTAESLDILLAGTEVPRRVMPEFGDVQLGIFEGGPLADYRAWRAHRPLTERPPSGGESRVDALIRYIKGAEILLRLDARRVIAVLHDIPIRFLANAANGDDPIDGPITKIGNMQAYTFTDREIAYAIEVMRMYAESHQPESASTPHL